MTEYEYDTSKNILDADLREDVEEMEEVLNRTKTAACMIMVQLSLGKGNAEVKGVLKDTKHDRKKSYDKIVSMMLDNCHNSIEERLVSEVNFILNLDSST